jgi:hypothetical protein
MHEMVKSRTFRVARWQAFAGHPSLEVRVAELALTEKERMH